VVNRAARRFWRLVALSTPGARLTALALALAILAAVGPERLESAPVVCVFKRVTGRDCYACGITRAISAAVRGDWGRAWSYNRLVLVLLPAVAVMAVLDVRRLIRKKKLSPRETSDRDSAAIQQPHTRAPR